VKIAAHRADELEDDSSGNAWFALDEREPMTFFAGLRVSREFDGLEKLVEFPVARRHCMAIDRRLVEKMLADHDAALGIHEHHQLDAGADKGELWVRPVAAFAGNA
jgi:hypothetical protein